MAWKYEKIARLPGGEKFVNTCHVSYCHCLATLLELTPNHRNIPRCLVGPCCALLQDYLSDTLLLCAMAFWRLENTQRSAIPISEPFQLRWCSILKWSKVRCDTIPPLPKRYGISAIVLGCHMTMRAKR